LTDRIDIGDKLVACRERTNEFDFEIPARLADMDAVFLTKALKQLNTLLQHLIPAVTLGVVERLVLICSPFAVEGHGRVFAAEVGTQCLFKGPTEEHRGARVFLLPAVEITMAVAARAAQVMRDLGVAVGHEAAFVGRS
jgi:hypothetical protein